MNSLTAAQLKHMIDGSETFELVDVRAANLYQHNHIPGAVNVEAVKDFVGLLSSVISDKTTKIVIYNEFKEDTTDEDVATEAGQAGYTDVSVLQDGIAGWLEKGFPVQFGSET